MTIARPPGEDPGQPWEFRMPDGSRHRHWYTAARLPALLVGQLDRQRQEQKALLAAVTGLDHPDARTIRPGWAGERFDLHATVEALFRMRLPEPGQGAEGERQAA